MISAHRKTTRNVSLLCKFVQIRSSLATYDALQSIGFLCVHGWHILTKFSCWKNPSIHSFVIDLLSFGQMKSYVSTLFSFHGCYRKPFAVFGIKTPELHYLDLLWICCRAIVDVAVNLSHGTVHLLCISSCHHNHCCSLGTCHGHVQL